MSSACERIDPLKFAMFVPRRRILIARSGMSESSMFDIPELQMVAMCGVLVHRGRHRMAGTGGNVSERRCRNCSWGGGADTST